MKEMERRLKAEREARLLDRRGARQRLEEGRVLNEELKAQLERERGRDGGRESEMGRRSVRINERDGGDDDEFEDEGRYDGEERRD